MVQKINLVLSSLALIGIIFVLVNKTSNENIAYIDVRKLVENYKEFKPVTLNYQKKIQEWQSRINTLNAEFEEELKIYEQERQSMNLEQKAKREQELAAKQRNIQKYQENAQQQLKLEDDEAMKGLIDNINEFMKQYGEEHNYQMIIAAKGDNVAYADEGLDITDEVITALNNR